jgi:hypothetical protein
MDQEKATWFAGTPELNTFFGPATVNFRIKDARSDLA